jgi:hypothetical protein
MISLVPIHESIRDTLHKKIQAVSKDFTDKSLSVRSEMIQSEYTKAVWTKMFSPVDSTIKYVNTGYKDAKGKPKYKKVSKKGMDTVTIFGGELDETDSMSHGFDSIYTPRTSTVKGNIGRTDGLKRPLAGVKDISVRYKGGLSAIRTATINWVCWSFEDLTRLTPHFLAHGKGVLIEWGYNIKEVMKQMDFGKADMISGKAYGKIQDRIVELAGNYDAMAGIITNWEWSLRDDGGFDCVTKIVSRGVNILEGDVSGTGTTPKTKDGKKDLTIGEFVKILHENLVGLCGEEDHWYDQGDAKRWTTLSGAHRWGKAKDGHLQPPGTMYTKHDGWFWSATGGPWVTWGFFEDNILSKFVGRYERDTVGNTGKVINSFRSIEPVLSGEGKGEKLYKGNRGIPTSNLTEAKFESVKIRNSNWLLTMDFNRWILPGQFPAKHTRADNNIGENLRSQVKAASQATDEKNPPRFLPFAVSNDWDKGGYLRNILLSYSLIEKSFENVNTVKQGMSNLFNALNRDTDGFWNLEVVDDPYIAGNVKVVDANNSAITAVGLIKERERIIKLDKPENDEFGNPESPMFTFPSWGEKSIVKSQTLTSKVPSAMAVSAMYAGSAAPESRGENASFKAQAIAKLSSGEDGFDQSQKNIVMADRIGTRGKISPEVFGSRSPYGTYDENYQFKSDGNENTTVPSSANYDGGFGPGHGVPFNEVTYEEFLAKVAKGGIEGTDEEKADAAKKLEASEAETKEADRNFHRLHPKGINATGEGNNPGYLKLSKEVTGIAWLFGGDDQEWYPIYLRDGTLTEAPGFGLYMRRSLIDYLHGNGLRQKDEDRLKQAGEPMVPIELEIEIVGIGGIIPGNSFHVDYIPDQYKKYCVFQAISVNHTISREGWKTTIKGLPRVAIGELLKHED